MQPFGNRSLSVDSLLNSIQSSFPFQLPSSACLVNVENVYDSFQGICPGNRLQEIRTYDSGCYSMSPASSPCPSSIGSSTMSLLNSSSLSMTTSPSLSSQQELIYENTLHMASTGLHRQDSSRSRRSWQMPATMSNQVSSHLHLICGWIVVVLIIGAHFKCRLIGCGGAIRKSIK